MTSSATAVTGVATADPTLKYDFGLFSYVGCRCNAGFDNIYTVGSAGLPLHFSFEAESLLGGTCILLLHLFLFAY